MTMLYPEKMWRAEQETATEYILYDEAGEPVMYGWPIEDVEYYLLSQRADEYLRVDLKRQEEVVRLR